MSASDDGSTQVAGLGKGRVEALTDGIFATVMTVLILSLSVPVLAKTAGEYSQLVNDIQNLLPDILSYVISFVVLGFYWVRHHNMFHFIVRVGRTLLWINMMFLLTIGFVPFSTALMSRYLVSASDYHLRNQPDRDWPRSTVNLDLRAQKGLLYAGQTGRTCCKKDS